MKKKLYILEGRKRTYPDRYVPNETKHIIGVFTSPEKAQEWICDEGQEFYPARFARYKDYFYALCEVCEVNDLGLSIRAFYDKSGNKII